MRDFPRPLQVKQGSGEVGEMSVVVAGVAGTGLGSDVLLVACARGED